MGEGMNSTDDQSAFETQLGRLYEQFGNAEVSGETDDDIGNAILDLILQRERLRRGVPIIEHAEVDRETLEKLANCTDSDDPLIASTVGLVFERLARGRQEDGVKLLKALIEAKQRNLSEQQRLKATTPRRKHPVDELIREILKKDPKITVTQLLSKLTQSGEYRVFRIDEGEIVPTDESFKPIKISGLKDRLYRIKKF